MSDRPTLETIVALAKQRGFVWPGSDIYGGLASSWDYGPLGVELKNTIRALWWRRFVQQRLDVVGLESTLLMSPKVWEASGHVDTFHDPLVECKHCHSRWRVATLGEPRLKGRTDQVPPAGPCPQCGAQASFTEPAQFSLMFKTSVGPKEEAASVAYLRPETAQGMFVDWPLVRRTVRKRLPLGVAQVGKVLRNEVTPGNFIFRLREFEQMEIEYFVTPRDWERYFTDWLEAMHGWISYLGIPAALVHEREVPDGERAHYSRRTVDLEFDYPFGRHELYGLAYRGDFDLQRHAAAAGVDMTYTDPETGERFVPHVVEPTFGVDRTILAMLVASYTEETVRGERRVVLKLPPVFAPYQVAVLPLSRHEQLVPPAHRLAQELAQSFRVEYDDTQSIGRRYRRHDEIGTPYAVTVDFESLKDAAATVRDRDTMDQVRLPYGEIAGYIAKQLQAYEAAHR